jgi:hypothetical protein
MHSGVLISNSLFLQLILICGEDNKSVCFRQAHASGRPMPQAGPCLKPDDHKIYPQFNKFVRVKMMLNSCPAKYNTGSEDLTDKNQVNPLIRCHIHLFNILLTPTQFNKL